MSLFIKRVKIIILIKFCQMNLLYLILLTWKGKILLEDNVKTSNRELEEIEQSSAQTG
jgi:hypothetical protein